MARVRIYEPYGYREESDFDSIRGKVDDTIKKNEEVDEAQWTAFYKVKYSPEEKAALFYDYNGDLRGVLPLEDIYPSFIEEAEYDKEKNILRIKFDENNTIEIDLDDIIDVNEFGNGLVVVTDDEDRNGVVNIKVREGEEFLTVDEDGIGTVGIREAIKAAVDTEVGDRIDDVEKERERAEAREKELSDLIKFESERAQDVESQIWEAIGKEAAAREDVDQQLWTAINNEAAAREDVEGQIWEALGKEKDAREDVESQIWTALANETAAREDVESQIWSALGQEADARNDVDQQLWNALANETAAREDVESQIWEALGNETAAREDVESQIWTAINNEIKVRKDADDKLAEDIEAEEKRATDAEKDLQTQLGGGFGIRNTVEDNFNRIDETIDELSANTESRLKDVLAGDTSVNVDRTNPVKPAVSVNISTEVEDAKNNIIKLNADGLYAAAELYYNEATNTLTFKNTNSSKDIQLVSNSLIDRVYYDIATESIIIQYTVNGTKQEDVKVPVGDLITEWKTSTGHEGAVLLTKQRNAAGAEVREDILSAEVVVSDHDDNMLVNDNGSLYVSSAKVDANKKAIEDEANRAKEAEEGLQSQIDDLVESNDEAIESLKGLIETEKTRATNKENELSAALEAETSRATGKENELEAKLNEEIERSTAADGTLASGIVDANALIEQLNAALGAEKTRAEGAEASIDGKLEAEITRSTNKENELETAIKNNTITFSGTNSVSFTTASNDTGDGKVVKADVKIANSTNNIITTNDSLQGIYASVDLTYDPSTNDLEFSYSNQQGTVTRKTIALHGISIFDDMRYDEDLKALVLDYYIIVEGQNQKKQVVIPLVGLFNNYEIENPTSGSAVLLEKNGTTADTTYYLSARLNVSENEDNIAKIVDNRLFVDGKANNIKYEHSNESGVKNVKDMLDKLYAKLGEKAEKVHTHVIADVTDVDVDNSGVVLGNDKVNGTVMLNAGRF